VGVFEEGVDSVSQMVLLCEDGVPEDTDAVNGEKVTLASLLVVVLFPLLAEYFRKGDALMGVAV
jgi:hypothetical protein